MSKQRSRIEVTMRKIALLIATMACGLTVFAAPALANYRIRPGGIKSIQGKKGQLQLKDQKTGAVLGTLRCAKERGKNTQERKVVSLQVKVTYEGCTIKGEGFEANAEVKSPVSVRISRGKAFRKEQWEVRVEIKEDVQIRFTTRGFKCQIRIATGTTFQGEWRNEPENQSQLKFNGSQFLPKRSITNKEPKTCSIIPEKLDGRISGSFRFRGVHHN